MKRNRLVMTSLLLLIALAALGPLFAPSPTAAIGDRLQSPSPSHLLGTDQFSRDVFSRLAYGARSSLAVAFAAIAMAVLIGIPVGITAAARFGEVVRRCIDIALGVPRAVVLLVLTAAIGTISPLALALIIGATGWPPIARLARGEALRLRHSLHVDAARALGASPARMLVRHVLPGTAPAVIVAATLGIADVLLLEAGLSFIGLGIRPPAPSWGGMLLEAREYLTAAPWLLLAPAVALVLATSTATLLGDALRRALQPGSR